MRTVMRTGATSEGEEEVITVVVVVVVMVVVTMVSMGYGAGWQYLQYRYLSLQKKDLHVKHGCSMPHALGRIGITIAEREREAGGGRSDLLARFCKGPEVSRQWFGALSMTMAWMPLAVPMEFFVRGHGRDDFDLSFVTYLYLPTLPTPSHLPTYLYYLLPQ